MAGGAEKPVSKQARKEFEAGQRAAKQKRPEEARCNYEKAVELDPAFANAWFELGRLQVAGKELEAARKSYEAVIKADPRFLEAYLNLGILAENAGDPGGPIDVIQELMS